MCLDVCFGVIAVRVLGNQSFEVLLTTTAICREVLSSLPYGTTSRALKEGLIVPAEGPIETSVRFADTKSLVLEPGGREESPEKIDLTDSEVHGVPETLSHAGRTWRLCVH